MAIVQTVVKAGTVGGVRQDSAIVDVAATATADKVATIAHGLGAAPQEVYFTELLTPVAVVAQWAVTTINTTNCVLTKTSTAASANAAAQIRVVMRRPHTIGR